MPEPLFNNFEYKMCYLVKLVKLPITMCIFLGKSLSSIDLQFYTYKTSNTAISWVKEQFKNRFSRNFAHPVTVRAT